MQDCEVYFRGEDGEFRKVVTLKTVTFECGSRPVEPVDGGARYVRDGGFMPSGYDPTQDARKKSE